MVCSCLNNCNSAQAVQTPVAISTEGVDSKHAGACWCKNSFSCTDGGLVTDFIIVSAALRQKLIKYECWLNYLH